MSQNDLILAVDIGTGATKVVLFDALLRPVVTVRKYYPVHMPNRGWIEQSPEEIFQGVISGIREGLAAASDHGKVRGISISSQLYSVLAVDSHGVPLTNSLIWSDTRSAGVVERLRQHCDAETVRLRTGCPIDTVYPLAKIKWFKENLTLPRDARFISIKEYVIHRLTTRRVVDWSIASATGLFNIQTRDWEPASLSLLEITPENLYELVPPRRILSRWDPIVREEAGILADLPLVIGGGDGPLASLGVGAASSGALAVNVGTSAAVRAVIRQPSVDPQGRLWTYLLDDDLWVTGGMVSSGGIVFEWFLNNFFRISGESVSGSQLEDLYPLADQLASSVPPGADGLLFIPYLSGAQSPDWDSSTRGSFIGVDIKHQREHFTRAVLEGITRSIYRIAESIQFLLARELEEVYVTGGLAASPVWLQMAADMFGATVVVPETTEGSARGAAMLAMISLGMKSGLQDFQGYFDPLRKVVPDAAAHQIYHQQGLRFLEVLGQTRRFYDSGKDIKEIPS